MDAVLYLLLFVALIGLAIAVYTRITRAALQVRHAVDYRTRNDQDAAERISLLDPPAVDTEQGSDGGLLEDAYLALYGHAGFQRLRDAIHDSRKENPQP